MTRDKWNLEVSVDLEENYGVIETGGRAPAFGWLGNLDTVPVVHGFVLHMYFS